MQLLVEVCIYDSIKYLSMMASRSVFRTQSNIYDVLSNIYDSFYKIS